MNHNHWRKWSSSSSGSQAARTREAPQWQHVTPPNQCVEQCDTLRLCWTFLRF
ncbi:hypothetical protein HAX54_003017, partial [Datura stramonium]|nr:hypothetical protein [Datura stramonium]